MKKATLITLSALAFFTYTTQAQEKVYHANPKEKDWNYAQAYRSGNMLYISGTVGGGDMAQSIEKVYKNLETTLKKYNLDFTHVVKENIYTTDIDALKNNYLIRKQFYNEHTPAATWVQISRLLMPQANLEIELIAEIEKTP